MWRSSLRYSVVQRGPLLFGSFARPSRSVFHFGGVLRQNGMSVHTLPVALPSPPVYSFSFQQRGIHTNDAEHVPSNSLSPGGRDENSAWTEARVSLRETLPPSATELPEHSFERCIQKERMDEKYRLDKEELSPRCPSNWEFYHPEGTSLIYGRRIWVPSLSSEADGTSASMVESEEAKEKMGMRSTSSSKCKGRPAEKHFIRAQLTARDASVDPECDVRGEHFPFSFFVQPLLEEGTNNTVKLLKEAPPPSEYTKFFQEEELSFLEYGIEVRCDLVDVELRVEKVIVHGELSTSGPTRLPTPVRTVDVPSTVALTDNTNKEEELDFRSRIAYPYLFNGYEGPNLDEVEEDVLDGLYSWLMERRIDDGFAEFMARYSVWTEQVEYERWLRHLHDYVCA